MYIISQNQWVVQENVCVKCMKYVRIAESIQRERELMEKRMDKLMADNVALEKKIYIQEGKLKVLTNYLRRENLKKPLEELQKFFPEETETYV